MKIEEIDGHVHIDGKRIEDHYKERGIKPTVAPIISNGEDSCACGVAMLLVIAVGLDKAEKILHTDTQDQLEDIIAAHTGLTTAQALGFEQGWCSFLYNRYPKPGDPEYITLGKLARTHCKPRNGG
jgi:hypothetical protein